MQSAPDISTVNGEVLRRILVNNPTTGQLSHTKLWANIAGTTTTYKFASVTDAPEWLWFAYGSMVGGYALIKRGIAAIPQLAEIKQKGQNHVGIDE